MGKISKLVENYTSWVGVGLAGVFLVVKAVNITPRISDENFYFYAAKLLADGVLPYRDFFFQHLPGQIFLLAGILKLFGQPSSQASFQFLILKFVPILFYLGSAYFLYRILASAVSRLAAIGGAVFLLFSFSVLATSDHGSGVHEATFFVVLNMYLFSRTQYTVHSTHIGQRTNNTQHTTYNRGYMTKDVVMAGVFSFVGLLFRIYILPAVTGFAAYLFLTKRYKDFYAYVTTFLLPFFVVNATLYYFLGAKFLTPVWEYHFLKSEGIPKERVLTYFLQNEWMLLVLAFLGVLVVLGGLGDKNKDQQNVHSLFLLSGICLALQSIFLLVFADIYYFYLVTLVVFLAVLAGIALEFILSLTKSEKAVLGFILFFIAFNFYNYQTNVAQQSRVNIDKIVEDIQATTNGQDTIFGTYTVVPLAALLSGRGITENQLDTNPKRYSSGLVSSQGFTDLAVKSKIFLQLALVDPAPKTVQAVPGKILHLDMDYLQEVNIRDNCELFRVYPVLNDPENNAVLLWRCGGESN